MSNNLMRYLPGYYKTSKVMTNITNAEDIELKNFKSELNNTLNQFFVDLADTRLDKWEEELGIRTNKSKPWEYRRSVIKSKLRGQGTVTVHLLKNIAESYSNGEVDIIEDNPKYTFTIKFVGSKGIPPNMEDLKRTIEEIKPAHLKFEFEFTYLTWDEFDNYDKTWDEWESLNLTWDEFETYREVI